MFKKTKNLKNEDVIRVKNISDLNIKLSNKEKVTINAFNKKKKINVSLFYLNMSEDKCNLNKFINFNDAVQHRISTVKEEKFIDYLLKSYNEKESTDK